MANFRAIAAVSKSLMRLLTAGFAAESPLGGTPPVVVPVALAQTEDFDRVQSNVIGMPGLSIYLHRIEPNRTMRAAWSGVASQDGCVYTPLDLHYLLTAWATNAEHEQQILGRAIQWLDAYPVLSGPLLDSSAGAAPLESVQLALDDVSSDMLFRMFDVLPAKYRLSVTYVARVVRIDGIDPRVSPPVIEAVAGIRPGFGETS